MDKEFCSWAFSFLDVGTLNRWITMGWLNSKIKVNYSVGVSYIQKKIGKR